MSSSTSRDTTQGTLAMLAVVLIWGSFLPIGKSALTVIDPYWFSTLRYGVAGLVFLLLVKRQEGALAWPQGAQARAAAFFGLLGFTGFGLCMFEGLRLTRPEVGAMILAINPVLSVLFQWWRQGRRPARFTLWVILAVFLGEALVVTGGDPAKLTGGDLLGNLLMFIAALCWTAYTLGGQRFAEWSPLRYSALTCAPGWLGILAATLMATAIDHARPPTASELAAIWPQLAYVAIVVSFVSLLLWNVAVARIGPVSAGLYGNFAPVVTYLIAIASGRLPVAAELAGVVLVITALVANNRYLRRQAAAG